MISDRDRHGLTCSIMCPVIRFLVLTYGGGGGVQVLFMKTKNFYFHKEPNFTATI